jgi:hypothetical protein
MHHDRDHLAWVPVAGAPRVNGDETLPIAREIEGDRECPPC